MNDWAAFWGFLSNLAWAGTVAYLLGWRFLEPIERLIDRVTKIGPRGATLSPQQVSGQVRRAKASKPESSSQLPAPIDNDPILGDLIQQFLTQLQKRVGDDPIKREQVLLSALAREQVNKWHERAYNFIFGSQIRALRLLNNSGWKVDVARLKAIFEDGKEQYPQIYGEAQFEEWMKFLLSWRFVTQDDTTICLTPIGHDFLGYLTDAGLSEDRAG